MSQFKNLIVAFILSAMVVIGWQYFYAIPNAKKVQIKQEKVEALKKANLIAQASLDKSESINVTNHERIKILSDKLEGSIYLHGARIDDLTMLQYKETLAADSPNISLLAPSISKNSYFSSFGWISPDKSVILPTSSTIWKADKTELTPSQPVILSWDNKNGLLFSIKISMDDDYLFTITQNVANYQNREIDIAPFGLISRVMHNKNYPNTSVIHEGALAMLNGVLTEYKYDEIEKKDKITFDQSLGGWLGIGDKYWLTALIPDQNTNIIANFSENNLDDEIEKFQIDYVGHRITVSPSTTVSYTQYFFAGAKVIKILDKYEEEFGFPKFDRTVDFGWLYFLTKPMFFALQMLFEITGNFGIAIILLTVAIKIILFPLANKSYVSMYRMKKLQPVINDIRKQYADDKMRFNQELMRIYRNEKINPLSGCMPLLIQIPVFFALYKVLFVSIEMRHAPFFGWIKDLSAQDPTSVFNLFGMLPFTPPSMLQMGIWPIIMGVTMYLQQKMNPEPADPIQAKVIKFLPILFVVMFFRFPAGLIIYWACNNLLSIMQQYLLERSMKGSH
jgi:YidC/Oxa1 family membrane protein insertase